MHNNRSSFLSQVPPVVLNVIIINLLLWIASIILPTRFNIDIVDLLGLHYWQSDKFHVYQLVSYMFLHDTSSFSHIFFNMFSVYMFGRFIEQIWGAQKFLVYYFVTGIGAAVVQQVVWSFDLMPIGEAIANALQGNGNNGLAAMLNLPKGTAFSAMDLINIKTLIFNKPITIGASGAVFGLLLAFGMLFPNLRLMLLFPPIPIRAGVLAIIYGVIELFFGVANFSNDNVAHFAHLGGMLFGIILILYWKKKGNMYS